MSSCRRLSPSTLLRLGMACLAISPVVPRLVHPATASGTDWLDGVRGLMLGMGIGLLFLYFRRKRSPASSRP